MSPFLAPGLALTALGLHLTLSYARDLYFGRASRGWPQGRAEIRAIGGHMGSAQRGDSAGVLTYVYVVAGRRYESRRYDYAGRNVGAGAGKVLHAHPVGTEVPVWYDPDRPARAVLAPGVTWGNYARLLVAALPLTLGLLSLLAAL